MSEEHDDAVTTKHDGETSGEALCALRTIAALLRGGVDTGPADALDWVSAKMRSYADQIEAAAVALYVGFSTMWLKDGGDPPKGLPLDKLSAASERLAEIATRRLEDAIRKFSKQ